MFTEETRKEIENVISDYCEGITWLEFNKDDFPKIIDDIEGVVKKLNKHIVSNNERSDVAVCCATCKYVDGCRCNHPQGCETNGDYELWEQKTDC